MADRTVYTWFSLAQKLLTAAHRADGIDAAILALAASQALQIHKNLEEAKVLLDAADKRATVEKER